MAADPALLGCNFIVVVDSPTLQRSMRLIDVLCNRDKPATSLQTLDPIRRNWMHTAVNNND